MLITADPYMENIMIRFTAPPDKKILCVGIDLHQDTLTVAALDPITGEVSFRKFACKCREQIVDYFRQLPRPHVVAIESVGFYRWLWDLLEEIVDRLVLLERQLARLDDRIRPMLDEPRFAEQAHRLMTFPGVGRVITATILAEVGSFARFDRRDAITRYAGLDSRLFSSADTHRTGRIAKTGSRELRWALVQAAWTAVRCDDSVKALWLRLRKRIGGKRAIVAVARRMLRWMWSADRHGVDYGVRAAA